MDCVSLYFWVDSLEVFEYPFCMISYFYEHSTMPNPPIPLTMRHKYPWYNYLTKFIHFSLVTVHEEAYYGSDSCGGIHWK